MRSLKNLETKYFDNNNRQVHLMDLEKHMMNTPNKNKKNSLNRRQNIAICVLACVITSITAYNVTYDIALQTPTADEHLHLTRGLKWWKDQDAHLSYGHPPFANVIQALPSAFDDDSIDLHSVTPTKKGSIPHLANPLFNKYQKKMRSSIVAGRYMTAAFFLLFLIIVFSVIQRFWDPLSALLVLILLAFFPSILAHAQLVTTDSIFACMVTLLILSTAWTLASRTLLSLVPTGILVGLTLVSKHAAPIYIIIIAATVMICAFFSLYRYTNLNRQKRLLHLFRDITIIVLLSSFTVFAAYHFQQPESIKTLRAAQERSDFHPIGWAKSDLNNPVFNILPESLLIPLPYTYVYGMANVFKQASGGHSSYYLSKRGSGNWLSYYSLNLLLKTPFSYLLLFLVTTFFFLRKKYAHQLLKSFKVKVQNFSTHKIKKQEKRSDFKEISMLLWFLISSITFTSASISHLCGGIRYVLPAVYIFTILLALSFSYLLQQLFPINTTTNQISNIKYQASIVLLIIFLSILKVASVPDYLGDFNILIGRERGIHLVLDTDWGQDASRLLRWRQKSIKEHDPSSKIPLYYQPYSHGDRYELNQKIKYHTISCGKTPKEESLIAIHRQMSFRSNHSRCYPWLRTAKRVALIHNHIEVFHYIPASKKINLSSEGKNHARK